MQAKVIQRYSGSTNQPLEPYFPEFGISLLESHHAPDFQMAFVKHSFFKSLFVIEGEGTFHTTSFRWNLRAGDILLVPDGLLHKITDLAGKPMALLILCVKLDVLEELHISSSSPRARLIRNRMMSREIREILRRILVEQSLKRPSYVLMIKGLILEHFAICSRIQESSCPPDVHSPETPAVARIEEYIKNLEYHFHHPQSIVSIGHDLGVSPRYFTNIFQKKTGTTWLRYLQLLRIRHACTLLKTTRRLVITIAFECGFDDLSTFYRTFKKLQGMTPERWRKYGKNSESSKK